MNGLFTKTETTFFKGIGILMIVIHNFFHSRKGFGIENESSFSTDNVAVFLKQLTSLSFEDGFAAFFGFLGHYGVQIFIFFSAYGLCIQYQKKTVSDIKFVFQRLKKIYFLMFFGIAFCVAVTWLQGTPMSAYEILKKSFLLGTTISSFTEWYLYGMFTGPFWFFALMIQLYILFPIIYKVVTRFPFSKIWIPFVVSFSIIYVGYFLTKSSHITVLGSIIGHLPEVILGICLAHFKIRKFNSWLVLAATIVFGLSQFFEVFFPLSFLAVSVLLIQLFSWLSGSSPTMLKRIIIFFGEISMILFVVNGKFRFIDIFSNFSLLQFSYYMPLLIGLSYVLYLVYNYLTKALKI